MSKFGIWVVAAIAVFTLLYLVYLAATFEAPTGTTTVIVPATAVQSVAEPAPVITPTLPQTRLQPREEPPAVAATPVIIDAPVEVEIAAPILDDQPTELVELPSLNDSDDFVFEGATFRSMHKQIGNAVPVLLAEKVAKEIKKRIESKSLRTAA